MRVTLYTIKRDVLRLAYAARVVHVHTPEQITTKNKFVYIHDFNNRRVLHFFVLLRNHTRWVLVGKVHPHTCGIAG